MRVSVCFLLLLFIPLLAFISRVNSIEKIHWVSAMGKCMNVNQNVNNCKSVNTVERQKFQAIDDLDFNTWKQCQVISKYN